jgi:large subunit ribosomal protein L27
MKASHVIAALLAQAGTASAFSVGGTPVGVEVASRLRGEASLRGSPAPEVPRQPAASANSGLLAGAFAAAAVLLGSRRKATAVSRNSWTREPAYPGMEQEGDPSRGPSFRTWINLKKRASKVIGRQRFFRQQKFLAEAGIQCAKGGYQKWYPNRDAHNLYKGPESHPNNPDFPAASPGYQAIRASAPAQLAASTRPSRRSGAFVSGLVPAMRSVGSAKRAVRGGRACAAIVLHAHKKAASSTRNQGNKSSPKYWGVQKKGLQGNAVKAGQLLVAQKGYNWYPGANVVKCGDFSLRAVKDGIVQWRGSYKNREVCVVPWEYVRAKCTWINPNTLGPKVYEPWMGTRTTGKRDHILRLRKDFLESDEGKEWTKKKEEKKAKQAEIQAKIRAFKKLQKAGKVTERVAAGESDSEKEA